MLKRQLPNSPPQQNRPFEPFCHPIPKPYSLGVCAWGWGMAAEATGKLTQNHRFFWVGEFCKCL